MSDVSIDRGVVDLVSLAGTCVRQRMNARVRLSVRHSLHPEG